jgi:hypothetical protein
MSKVLVFGAGGRAGRAAVDEAISRGHEVTAAVRDPSRYADLPTAAKVVAADVTLPGDVARLAADHDAVVAAVYDGGADPADFFVKAARALSEGVGDARLVWVGLASILETGSGGLLMDAQDYPQEYRAFYLTHQAAVEIFAGSALDWVSIAPAGDFDHDRPARTGGYQVIPAHAASRISYADLAIALLDEIDAPRHHRARIGVAPR